MAEKHLDCRGLNGPQTVLKTKKALMSLNAGDVLKVVATDPGSVADMAALSRSTGHEIIEQSKGSGKQLVYVFRPLSR